MGNSNSHTASTNSSNGNSRHGNGTIITTTTNKTSTNTATTILRLNGTSTTTTEDRNMNQGTVVHHIPPNSTNKNRNDNDDDSDTNEDCQFPCFLFFSPRQIPFIQNLSHHNHFNNVNNNSSHHSRHQRKKDPVLGSPLPDTPVMERRRRQEITQKASTVLQREQQQSSSRSYNGLEREESSSSRSIRLSNLIPPTNPNGSNTSSSNNNNNNILTNVNFMTPPNDDDNGETHTLLHRPPQQSQLPPPLTYPEAEIYEGDDCEEKLYEKYELCEVLGVGSTSTVHRCIHKVTGNEYACKVIDIQNMDVQYHSMMIQFHTEITSLKSIHHPGIIQLYDVYILSTIKIYIIMELMLGGELFDYVVEKGTLSEEEAAQIVRTVLSAIHYLHRQNIIHRDLKPENLLLKYKPNSSNNSSNKKNNNAVPIDVKIIDFGLSKLLTTDDTVASTFLGTRGYLAPEMLQRREYTSAVDTWAMGVIVFVLLCGCLPFDDDATMIMPSDDQILQKRFVLRFPRWAKNLSASAKDLLNHLLDINPLTRYTAEQALYHPWVRGETAPSKNLLASPGRIRKSPALTHTTTSNNKNQAPARNGSQNTKNYLGRKYAPDPCSLTPPTPRVRKGSF